MATTALATIPQQPPTVAEAPTINVLIATFAGLGLPRTLSLPTQADASIGDVYASILSRMPSADDESIIITTVSNKQLLPSSHEPIASLLSSTSDTLLSLRLSRRLCGGKGGFGSQLRAAGGRMSSRKNRDKQDVNGSNRNLDGRRLRTVDEAKRLAEYLAIKPGMEKKEKDERKKRWQDIVDSSERREEEIKSGKVGANGGRLNAEYVESKQSAEEKTREAVLKAMREGTLQLERTGSESSELDAAGSEDNGKEGSSGSSEDVKRADTGAEGGRTFFGWDDADDDEDDDEEDDEEAEGKKTFDTPPDNPVPAYEGKGKARAP